MNDEMKTITCPRCGSPAPYGAPGCPNCKAAFVPPPKSASQPQGQSFRGQTFRGQAAPVRSAAKNWLIGSAVAGVAALGLAGSYFGPKMLAAAHTPGGTLASKGGETGQLAVGQTSTPPALEQAIENPQAFLEQTASSPVTTLAATKAAPSPALAETAPAPVAPVTANQTAMPQDIHDWLEHLRKTEDSRVALAKQQITQAVTALAQIQAQKMQSAMDQDPSDDPSASLRTKASTLTSTLKSDWNALLSSFDAMAAPAECAAAKKDYDQTIQATGQMMSELITLIESASQDPQAALAGLRKMQGTSGGRIDTFAQSTDSDVATICAHYQTAKWFSINKDVGDASMLSQFGG